MKLIMVKWRDAESEDDWVPSANLRKDLKTNDVLIESVGWYVGEGEQYLMLSSSYDGQNDNYGNYLKIPHTAIIKRRYIKTEGK